MLFLAALTLATCYSYVLTPGGSHDARADFDSALLSSCLSACGGPEMIARLCNILWVYVERNNLQK